MQLHLCYHLRKPPDICNLRSFLQSKNSHNFPSLKIIIAKNKQSFLIFFFGKYKSESRYFGAFRGIFAIYNFIFLRPLERRLLRIYQQKVKTILHVINYCPVNQINSNAEIESLQTSSLKESINYKIKLICQSRCDKKRVYFFENNKIYLAGFMWI